MEGPFDVITFDCYGTLIDWETGISEAMSHEARKDGIELDRADILELHAKIEPEVQAGAYRSYRSVLTEVARAVANRLGWRLENDRAGFLAESIADWRPFPDTNDALERLKRAGRALGILSNVDDDLFAQTRRHLSVDFDLVITAEQVRSYKPAPAHFLAARDRIGQRTWLHAAQSYFHDVMPARQLGIPVVWVNRNRDQPTGNARPDVEVRDLTELVDWVKDE